MLGLFPPRTWSTLRGLFGGNPPALPRARRNCGNTQLEHPRARPAQSVDPGHRFAQSPRESRMVSRDKMQKNGHEAAPHRPRRSPSRHQQLPTPLEERAHLRVPARPVRSVRAGGVSHPQDLGRFLCEPGDAHEPHPRTRYARGPFPCDQHSTRRDLCRLNISSIGPRDRLPPPPTSSWTPSSTVPHAKTLNATLIHLHARLRVTQQSRSSRRKRRPGRQSMGQERGHTTEDPYISSRASSSVPPSHR